MRWRKRKERRKKGVEEKNSRGVRGKKKVKRGRKES
jgi:hypothetical protein